MLLFVYKIKATAGEHDDNVSNENYLLSRQEKYVEKRPIYRCLRADVVVDDGRIRVEEKRKSTTTTKKKKKK